MKRVTCANCSVTARVMEVSGRLVCLSCGAENSLPLSVATKTRDNESFCRSCGGKQDGESTMFVWFLLYVALVGIVSVWISYVLAAPSFCK